MVTTSVLIVAKCIVNYDVFCTILKICSGINSSKVYCKSMLLPGEYNALAGINSSKVYCKLPFLTAEVVDYLKY